MKPKPRRAHGTGSLYPYVGSGGRETWYARWYVGRKRVQRRVGLKRSRGSNEGLTRNQAEAELRSMRLAEEEEPPPRASLTVDAASEQLMRHLESLGRRQTTLTTYRSIYRNHLAWSFDETLLDRVTSRDIQKLDQVMRRKGLAPKTRVNALKLASEIFVFAKRQGWCRRNPCEEIELPHVEPTSDIRFLDEAELIALLKVVDIDEKPFGHTDWAMFLTAAMTGLRQGELLGLRWCDVDFPAERIRVHRTYVRGHWGQPKSRHGVRSIPMANQVAFALHRHFARSRHRGYEALVFGHPHTGQILGFSAVGRRFKKALRAAGVREVRFHDLRHTFGTRLAANGVPMRTIQEWMGHADIKTTQIYTEYEPRDEQNEALTAAFSGVKLDP
jgi:integrase